MRRHETKTTWCHIDQQGLLLSLTVQASAKRTEIVGVYGDTLKVRVNAPPITGKANEALLNWLAAQLKLRRQAFELVAGATSRHKKIRIHITATQALVIQQLLCEFIRPNN